MKKTLLALAVIALMINSCKKDETPEITNVSTEHKSLLLDFTATWCCPCGGAIPIFEDVQSKFPNKVIAMSIHASNDTFYNQTFYWYWANIYGVTGIPTMVGDNREVLWGYVLPDLHLDTSDFYKIIRGTIAQNVPDCGIGIAKTIEGSTMTVKTKTVFFNEVKAKFNLAVYITEDDLYAVQNCNTQTVFDNIFRASLTDPQGAGKQISNGTTAIKKGTAFDNTFTYTIPSGYNANNLHIVTVVYEEGTGSQPVRIVNVNKL